MTNVFFKDIYRLAKRIVGYSIGGRFYCCYCEKNSPFFLPYRGGSNNSPSLMKVLDIIGSDLDNHLCPKCFSHDRERHLKLYFEALKLDRYIAGYRILHFAPERCFSKYIESLKPSVYIKADLFPVTNDTYRVDMLNTGYQDVAFDFVIANHVFEHVVDIERALVELHRILAPGGLAVFQTPYSNVLNHTFEDKGIKNGEARLQAFGQEDHVRLFGRDIFEFIESFGFISRAKFHDISLATINDKRLGVNNREPLFLFERMA